MTKEFNRAATVAGAFIKWYDMAIKETEKAVVDTKLPIFKRIRAKLAIRKMKKYYKKCNEDFTVLIDELEKLDGTEGSKERAEKVYKTIQRTFVYAKHEFEMLNTVVNILKFTRGGLNARD